MTAKDMAAPIPDDKLRAMLDDLLQVDMATDAFWAFVAALAQGRGVSKNLHEAGLDAFREVPNSPANSKIERQSRAYHIGLLIQLLMEAGRLPPQNSILPGNFKHSAVVHDLREMLSGPGGMGGGDPQILTSGKKGKAGLRKAARRRLIQAVYWRMGHHGFTREKAWFDMMGDDADLSLLNRWAREAGGRDGPACKTAFDAGSRGDKSAPMSGSNSDLAQEIALAKSGPGTRKVSTP